MFLSNAPGLDVMGEGSIASSITIVGDYTTVQAKKEGKPIVGIAGSLLEQTMHIGGLIKADCYITNVIKCETQNPSMYYKKSQNKKGYFLEPAFKYVEKLQKELSQVKSNVIVALGDMACLALINRDSVAKFRGYVFDSTLIPGKKVIPVIDPNSALFNYIFRYYMSTDFKKVKRESQFPEIRYPKAQVEILETFTQVKAFMDSIIDKKMFTAIDIEVANFQVSAISFAVSPNLAYAIPFYATGGEWWTADEETQIWKLISLYLENREIEKGFQNGIFDMQFLAIKNGIVTRGYIHDTMVAHSLLYPDFLKGLDFLASVYTDRPYWKDMVRFKGSDIVKGDN